MRRRLPLALGAPVVLAALLALTTIAHAHARPGGGEGYSGGGGHGGGSDDGGGGAIAFELIFQLIRLCFYYPSIGIPILLIVIFVLYLASRAKQAQRDWDSGPPVELRRAVPLDPIKQLDPDFSAILFQDFVFRLYATAHEARHDDRFLDELAPYLGPGARDALRARTPRGPVTGVIVGAMRPFFATLPDDPTAPGATALVGVELEANYSVETEQRLRTFYVIERWRLQRAATARTKPRDLAKGFPCPNCGAPWQAADTMGTQRCASCGEVVDNGRFDWQVVGIDLIHAKDEPPLLSTEVPERGTDLPTYVAPDVDATWARLLADDPALSSEALQARLGLIFHQLYDAWARGELRDARMYLSDGLFDYLSYWMEAYRAQGLVNRLEKMRITNTELARVARDRWYDAVTIRLWATGRDYVVRKADGGHVRGAADHDRPFSEYWTLIRSAGRRGQANAEPTCSNCGAPAKVGMTGACEFCGAHVTSGEFDWVLSRIEQDDSYRG
jgi:hypothetical protein